MVQQLARHPLRDLVALVRVPLRFAKRTYSLHQMRRQIFLVHLDADPGAIWV